MEVVRVELGKLRPGMELPCGVVDIHSACRWNYFERVRTRHPDGIPQRLSVPVASLHRVDTIWMTVLAAVAEALNEDQLDWMLLGSAATALRGAAIEPGDVDIAISSAADVTRAATLLPTPESRDTSDRASTWISTTAEPTLALGDAGERWTFGRWFIHGVKVELAHIEAPTVTDLLLETRGPRAWAERDILRCHGQSVPTVPVEVQLATMIARGQDDRVRATLDAIDVSQFSPDRLRRAISDKRAEVPDLSVPERVRQLMAQGSGGC